MAPLRKRSDLTPPLGHPGGPCHVVDRIQKEVRNPRVQEHLVGEIERGKSLSNPEAAEIYDLESEIGIGGPFKQIILGPHSLYRMDLRGVTLPAIRATLKNFSREYNDAKSRRSPQFERWGQEFNQGGGINWTDPRLGLTIVFANGGYGRVKIITTYWKGEPDPKAHPGECRIQLHASRVAQRYLKERASISRIAGKHLAKVNSHPMPLQSVRWVQQEVLTPQMKKAIDDFARAFVTKGQSIRRIFSEALDNARNQTEGGQYIRDVDAFIAVKHYLKSGPWSDDNLLDPLASVIAYGDYVF